MTIDYAALVQGIVFYLFAGIAILAAIGMVLARSPIRSALSLAVVFVALAGLYFMLNAPFLAVAQIMIYAGAVLILFLFVIMVLNPRLDVLGARGRPQTVAAVVFVVALGGLLVATVATGQIASGSGPFTPEVIAEVGHVQVIGALLFTDFLLPFEIASVLLLVAILGAMTLARREGAQGKNIEGEREMMITVTHYTILSAVLFSIGALAVLVRRNPLIMLMGVELMLNAVNLSLIAFSSFLNEMTGQVFVFIVLTVAAAEVAVGLALVVAIFRARDNVDVDEIDALRG